jgi:hypothetical protein
VTTDRTGPDVRRKPNYFVFGLRVRSELALPELEPMATDDGGEPDVEIRLDALAPALPSVRHATAMIQIGDGDCLVTVTKVARYRVRNGTEIIVDPAAGSSERNIRLFLLGTALAALCHQRGLLPLHASAVEADGRAIAFMGPSGAGKSTLAARLQSRGYRVLCDDVCVVSFDADGQPQVWPGLPRLRLWGDAVTALGRDAGAFDRVHDGMDKYLLPFKAGASWAPLPLACVYVLHEDGRSLDEGVRPLTGAQAVDAVMANTYRGGMVAPMGRSPSHFMQCTAIARQIGVYAVDRRSSIDTFIRRAEETPRISRGVSVRRCLI